MPPSYATEPVTLGEAMLRAVPSSVARIAEAVGLRSPQSVQFWRHGVKRPGPVSQQRLAEDFGIPIDAWSRPPVAGCGADVPPELGEHTAPANTNGSALAGMYALLRELRSRRPAPDGGKSMGYLRSIRFEMNVVRYISQLERAAEALDDRIIRTNPKWTKLRDGLAEVLSHYPEAAERVAAALDRLDT
jgi:transcriptional regulator with XRE-family HTH domain